ncbi:MAG: hypothetical protein GWO02_07065 [Gammaproteobacteria bacterium]|nr:hypothetical protein [Gammaproteobacteria bacterium]
MSTRWRLAGYGATVFLASALLLVLEIVAGRLIAPYVGASLYTWTSVIGVILAGLSLGNWLGGRWADRGAGDGAAGLALALGGLASLAILLILTVIAPAILSRPIGLLTASFVLVAALFFLPSVLLGVITPLLTTRALAFDRRSGHVVGRMQALAALGSILGTFVTGYWLVQHFGTRALILGVAGTQLVLALPFFYTARARLVPAALAAAAAALLVVTHAREGLANPCDRESRYFCIRVAAEPTPYGPAQVLVLDHLVHSMNHVTRPGLLIPPYMHAMDELVRAHFGDRPAGLRFFFAGGGAYTQPRAVRALYERPEIVVAELDPAVTEAAVDRLSVSLRGMEVVHRDARLALRESAPARFDVIVGDVFHDVAVPFHLLTREFAALVRSRLAPGGIYVLNVVDGYPGADLARSVAKTLHAEFRHVDLWLGDVPEGPTRLTYVISATDAKRLPARIVARHGPPRVWHRATERLAVEPGAAARVPVLTDDYAPVERLVSELLLTEQGR